MCNADPGSSPDADRIRPIVLGLIRHGDRLLVAQGQDEVKQETFYRALGGGIEFGETSLDALKREFWEELQAELTHIQYVGCVENLFVYNGKPGHELIQLYTCDFLDPTFYQLERIEFYEDVSDTPHVALWIEIQRFVSGELILYPEVCLDTVLLSTGQNR